MGRGPLHARNTASVLPHADNMRQVGCTATSERPGAICPGHKRLSWVPTELQLNTGFIPPSCCLITGGAQKIFDEQEKVRTKKHTHWAPLQVWMPSSASHWTHRPGQAWSFQEEKLFWYLQQCCILEEDLYPSTDLVFELSLLGNFLDLSSNIESVGDSFLSI